MADLPQYPAAPAQSSQPHSPQRPDTKVVEPRRSGYQPGRHSRKAPTKSVRRKSGGKLLRRLSWNLGDQIISSLTNLSLSLVVARSVPAESFGAFSVAFIVFGVGILITRSLVGQALSMRFSGHSDATFRPAVAGATGATLLIASTAGAICVAAGIASGSSLGRILIVMGLGLPGLLLQDTWRMVFFAQLRPARAAANDFLWMVLQIAFVAVALVADKKTVVIFVAIWSVTGAVSAIFGLFQFSIVPSLRKAWPYLRDQWDITRFLLSEQVAVQGAYQGVLLLIGAIGTLAEVGALRGAMVLLGPVGILAVSVTAFGIPELSRRKNLKHDAPKVAAIVSLVMMVASVAWISLFLALPDSAGRALLGDSWPNARAVLIPTLVYQLGLCAGDGPSLVIYALGKAKESFRVHVIFSILLIAGALIGLPIGGAGGAALGMGIDAVIMVPVWWYVMFKLLKESDAVPAAVATEAEAPVELLKRPAAEISPT